MTTSASLRPSEGYLLLADISGFTGFLGAVGDVHSFDPEQGIPPAFALLGDLQDAGRAVMRPAAPMTTSVSSPAASSISPPR